MSFLAADEEQHQCFVVRDQGLNLLCGQRQRVRQRRIVRELAGEDLLQCVAFPDDRGDPVSDPLLSGGIALGRLLGHGRNDRLVEGVRLHGEVLILADQLSQAIAAGCQADGELVDGGGRRRSCSALDDIQAVVEGLLEGNQAVALGGEENRESHGRAGA